MVVCLTCISGYLNQVQVVFFIIVVDTMNVTVIS